MKEAISTASKLIRTSSGDDQKVKANLTGKFPQLSAPEIQEAIDSAWASLVKKFEKGR